MTDNRNRACTSIGLQLIDLLTNDPIYRRTHNHVLITIIHVLLTQKYNFTLQSNTLFNQSDDENTSLFTLQYSYLFQNNSCDIVFKYLSVLDKLYVHVVFNEKNIVQTDVVVDNIISVDSQLDSISHSQLQQTNTDKLCDIVNSNIIQSINSYLVTYEQNNQKVNEIQQIIEQQYDTYLQPILQQDITIQLSPVTALCIVMHCILLNNQFTSNDNIYNDWLNTNDDTNTNNYIKPVYTVNYTHKTLQYYNITVKLLPMLNNLHITLCINNSDQPYIKYQININKYISVKKSNVDLLHDCKELADLINTIQTKLIDRVLHNTITANNTKRNTLSALPSEIQLNILTYLNSRDLINVMQLNHIYYDLAHTNTLWQMLYYSELHTVNRSQYPKSDWYNEYIIRFEMTQQSRHARIHRERYDNPYIANGIDRTLQYIYGI